MRPSRLAPSIWALAVLMAGIVLPAAAQVITGTISGTVTDTSGSVIPEAKVTVTDTSTGLVRTGATGPDGQFVLPFLPVGVYTLRVERPGFKTSVREGIGLSVNQIAGV